MRQGTHTPNIADAQQSKSSIKAVVQPDNRSSTRQFKALLTSIEQHPQQVAERQVTQLQASRPNRTGMPDTLKVGVENLSGQSLDEVRVHYNSDKPAQFQAHAYAQGSEIHLAPGQEKHLPHEAWHVAQQKQGRVQPTTQLNGVRVNDNRSLEQEADLMGARAEGVSLKLMYDNKLQSSNLTNDIVQRAIHLDLRGAPAMNATISIRKIERPATPKTSDIVGEDAADPSARHIIPQALIDREFKARYNGMTVAALQANFPSVAIGPDYLLDLATAMQKAYLYENKSLNRAGKGIGSEPEGAKKNTTRIPLVTPENDNRGLGVAPAKANDKTSINRNYWEGSQAANLAKDGRATVLISTVDYDSDVHFGLASPAARLADPGWVAYQKSQRVAIIKALAEEFDPSPFTGKHAIQEAADEWARLTNSWVTNDPTSRSYYDIGRPFAWYDAVTYGDNKKVYNAAK